MLFSLSHLMRKHKLRIVTNNTQIHQVKETKFLGVLIDESLSWSTHIEYIANKISKSLGILNKVKHVLNKETLLMLYYSLVYPYLTYCILVWGNTFPTHLQRLSVLQKKAIRVINHSAYNAHTDSIFAELGIMRFTDLYVLSVCIFVYKCIRGIYPTQFLDIYNPYVPAVPTLSHTRRAIVTPLQVPRYRTALRERSLHARSIALYHEFIHPLRLIDEHPTIASLKRALKSILN